jgi:glycerol-3-phosphate acyltransferase PlsY
MTVVGHMFTCFMKFKGGKGVATGFGMLVALLPCVVLSAFAVWVVVMLVSHYISLGSIVAAAYLGVVVWIPISFMNSPGYHNLPQCIVVTIVALASILKHRTNIQRLLAGNENKIY